MKKNSLQERWGKEVLTQVEFNIYWTGGWGGGGLHVHCIKFKKEALQARGWWLLLFSSIRCHKVTFLMIQVQWGKCTPNNSQYFRTRIIYTHFRPCIKWIKFYLIHLMHGPIHLMHLMMHWWFTWWSSLWWWFHLIQLLAATITYQHFYTWRVRINGHRTKQSYTPVLQQIQDVKTKWLKT